MIYTSEQTRKFMDNIKNANIKFKVDSDIEKRILKEDIEEMQIEDINYSFLKEQKLRRLIRHEILKEIKNI